MCNREISSRRVELFFSAKLYAHQGPMARGGGSYPPPSTGEGGEIRKTGEGKIWPQVKVTAWPKLHISRSVLTRQTHWDHFHVSSSSQSQVICKNLLVTSVTSDDLSGVNGQHLTLGHHEWPKSTWSWKNYTLLMRWEGFQYFPHWLIMERPGACPDPRS